MMRALVWPWHGRVQNSRVHLPNGDTHSYSQGSDTTTLASVYAGPGDTHLIRVPDIDPITPTEADLAPPGGEWWAGQALIGGGRLYGMQLDGWIYQGAGGIRWLVQLRDVVITADNTVGQIVTRRFGEFLAGPQEQVHPLELGYGFATAMDASRLMLHHRPFLNGLLRLHAVSETGQHAVLALMAHNSANWSPTQQLDRRPRAYRFYLASVAETEHGLSVEVELLYDIEAIRPPDVTTRPSQDVVTFSGQRSVGEELSREPVFNPSGDHTADLVTYTFDEHVEIDSVVGISVPGPGVYENTYQWMWGVRFEGETPVPMYIRLHSSSTVGPLNLSWRTIEPCVRRESLEGGISVAFGGLASINASRLSTTEITVEMLGAAEEWRISLAGEARSTLTLEGGLIVLGPVEITTEWSLGDNSGTVQGVPARYAYPGSVSFTSSAMSGNPTASLFAGAGDSQLMFFDLFANNCLGVARGDYVSASYVFAMTPDGPIDETANYSHLDQRRYGSYNPVTGEVILAATSPVTWT